MHENIDRLHLIDVRDRDELVSGRIARAQLMPLPTLREHLDEVPRDLPIIVICASAARSAVATTILEKAGVANVANMRGGMLEWQALGLPIADAPV